MSDEKKQVERFGYDTVEDYVILMKNGEWVRFEDFERLEKQCAAMRNVLLQLAGPFDAARSVGMPIGKATLTHDSKLLAGIRAALKEQP